MKTVKKYKKVIIVVASVLLSFFLVGLGIFMLLISPATLEDFAFELKVAKEIEKNGFVDFAKMTDFEWDTMYDPWNCYGPLSTANEIGIVIPKGFPDKGGRDENAVHYLFVLDGVLVKHYMVSGNSLFPTDLIISTAWGEDSVAKFAKEDAVFEKVYIAEYGSPFLRHIKKE